MAETLRRIGDVGKELVFPRSGFRRGWIEDAPGVNAQEATREELLVSIREMLNEALEF